MAQTDASVAALEVCAYAIPTAGSEADGTFRWNKTTLVVVFVEGGGRKGIGYTYADAATAALIRELATIVVGSDAFETPAIVVRLAHAVRNLGRPGIASMALSAIDAALWDLKAKLLDLPLVVLLGRARDSLPLFGSG